MSQNSGSFYWFFSNGSFFADLRRNKVFQLAESPYFCLSQQKKETVFFGTCKQANTVVNLSIFKGSMNEVKETCSANKKNILLDLEQFKNFRPSN